MLNIKYDPSRPYQNGQYYVELITFDPVDSHVERFGYWCDEGHLIVAIINPILHELPKLLDKASFIHEI